MATEATFRVEADQFPLGTVFENLPDVTVELERLVPAKDAVIPYFWVRGARVDDIEAAFENHPGVRDIALVDRVDDEYLLKVEWNPDYEGFLKTLAEADSLLLGATGTERSWTFEVRGDDRSDIARFQEVCLERDIPVTLTAVHDLTPMDSETYGLTDPQREALELAYERGYFDSPRKVTLAEVAAELDISQQAFASRIRRGTHRLLGETIVK
ncbi:bacterio-opsin activator domain-containing protein [Halorussus caseinilyticus]|uniref:Bacterio-opsin activator domain-containing protein n=1 Tax=Halorussus caseinilyticus TaxID=3034025 RepID=A0ABD5WM60_9EURY|nr:bacterio-opsin activator domain-containing protein [Halorussus sp. DT72]